MGVVGLHNATGNKALGNSEEEAKGCNKLTEMMECDDRLLLDCIWLFGFHVTYALQAVDSKQSIPPIGYCDSNLLPLVKHPIPVLPF